MLSNYFRSNQPTSKALKVRRRLTHGGISPRWQLQHSTFYSHHSANSPLYIGDLGREGGISFRFVYEVHPRHRGQGSEPNSERIFEREAANSIKNPPWILHTLRRWVSQPGILKYVSYFYFESWFLRRWIGHVQMLRLFETRPFIYIILTRSSSLRFNHW